MIDYKSQISVSFKVTIAGATVKPIVFTVLYLNFLMLLNLCIYYAFSVVVEHFN